MSELPSGTVTFLFTDIEGSTRLLHELGDDYAGVLAEHRRALREAFDSHGGVEVDTQGDAFFVAFARATDALAAAEAVQLALADGPVRVRIGIHTGEPLVTGEGYVGVDVHRAARVMSAGHGGQVLVSEATQRLTEEESGLRDLGLHRLKDMTAPQRLYQLGDGDFPALRSLNRTNLPVQPTPLIGREGELVELAALLGRDDVRLVTLTGPGGSGKTRLGLQAAAEAVDRMPDGIFWVSLAPIPSSELVLSAVARALEVREVAGEPLELTLRSFLSSRRLLLLLDNFEHLLGARSLLAELLAGCPQLHLLVTSRSTLTLTGEHVYEVPPLRADEAVELFVERARQAGAEVAADATVAAICDRLDRLPLALELAAARARLLEPQALLERLEQRLPLLKGGAADLPVRQQTLYATIAWSHDLLDEPERTLFRRLSVFAGSFTLESAEAIAEADLWTVESLLAKSLIRRWGSGRLGLLETIREYAAEQLEQTDEAERLRDAHAHHYLELAVELEPRLAAGAQRVGSVELLGAELDNLRAALSQLEQTGQEGKLLRLATAMWRFWMARGYGGAGLRWLERGLRSATDAPEGLRARALEGLGVLNFVTGNLTEAEAHTSEALRLYRGQGDARGTAETLNNLGVISVLGEDFGRSEALFREANELARAADETHLVALTVSNLAQNAADRQEYDRAVELLEEATRVYEQLGDTGWQADQTLILASVLFMQGRLDEAAHSFAAALAAADTLPHPEFAACGLVGVAAIVAHEHDRTLATELVGAADALFEFLGASWSKGNLSERAIREQTLAAAREHLGASDFEAAYRAGQQLTFDQAAAKALAALDQR